MNAYRTSDPSPALLALADPTRRAILESLRGRPRSVGELADTFPVSRPAVSQHLRVLKDAGLVEVEAVGTRRIYKVDPSGLAVLHSYLESYWNDALSAYGRAAARRSKR